MWDPITWIGQKLIALLQKEKAQNILCDVVFELVLWSEPLVRIRFSHASYTLGLSQRKEAQQLDDRDDFRSINPKKGTQTSARSCTPEPAELR